MTVATTGSSVTLYGNGVTVAFPYTFKVRAADNVKVDFIADGQRFTAIPATYVVTPNGDLEGGTVTFYNPPATGVTVYIYRVTTRTQDIAVSSQQRYDPAVAERVWDKLTMLSQEAYDKLSLAVKVYPGESPDDLLQDVLDATAAANAAAIASIPYLSRAAAQAADTGTATAISVIHWGARLEYVYDAAGTALTTGDGRTWSPAEIVACMHWGAWGDGITDDTAAINASFEYMRLTNGIAANRPNPKCWSGLGRRYRVTGSINATNIRNIGWAARDACFVSSAAGKTAFDYSGSRFYTFENLWVDGDETSMPYVGFGGTRLTDTTAAQFAAPSLRINCGSRGNFLLMGDLAYGVEATTDLHCSFWNGNPDSGLAAAYVGTDQWPSLGNATTPFRSDFGTPITGETSFVNRIAINCEYRFSPGGLASAISNITQAGNAVVTVANGSRFAVGQKVVVAEQSGMPEIGIPLGTITAIAGNNITTDIDSSAFTAYTSGGTLYRAQTSPTLVAASSRDLTFQNCYIVNYGTDCIQYFAGSMQRNRLHFGVHCEGYGSRSLLRFPEAAAVIIADFSLITSAVRTRTQIISTDVADGSYTQFRSFKISVASSLFDDARLMDEAKFRLYFGEIVNHRTVALDASAFNVAKAVRVYNINTASTVSLGADTLGDITRTVGASTFVTETYTDGSVSGFKRYLAGKFRWAPDGGAAVYEMTSAAFTPVASGTVNLGTNSTPFARLFTNTIQTVAAAGSIGYAQGVTAGGTVSQGASKSNGVTLNRRTGRITSSSAALAAGASVIFTLTNSTILDTSIVLLNVGSPTDKYQVQVCGKAAGSVNIRLTNITGGSLSENVVIDYALIEAAIT